MPIFGRYLLKNYLKVLLLSIISFIAILLVSRLEEIAEFASLGAPILYLFLFTLYQIPYILPISIPISCLISSLLLFQRLSYTQELTALRASGFSLKQIVAPILIAGLFLSLASFYITSELATTSHLATRKMVYHLTSNNPLILLQSAKIAKLKGSYIQMDPIHSGRAAHDLLIGLKNHSNGQLSLCLAKKIYMEDDVLKGENVSIISSVPGPIDHLVIENQEKLTASAPEFASLLRKQGWKIANDHLRFSLLRVREKILRASCEKRSLAKCHSEIARRFSLGISVFTFTLMGVSFGVEISRNRSKRGLFYSLALTAATLITFFLGKEFDHLVWIASMFFLLPHAAIISLSLWTLVRINRGIE